jgi:hypothetical protein
MSVDDVGANIFDQGSAGLKHCWDLPGALGGDIQIYGYDGGAELAVFGRGTVSGEGESDDYFKTQGAEDFDLVVDPGCSSGGFDDVQDLHEKRVVMVRSLDGRNETIPQKGAAR